MHAYETKTYVLDGVSIVLNPALRRMYILYGDHVCVYAEPVRHQPPLLPFAEVLCNMQADEILRQTRFPLYPPRYVDTPPGLEQAVRQVLKEFLSYLPGQCEKKQSA